MGRRSLQVVMVVLAIIPVLTGLVGLAGLRDPPYWVYGRLGKRGRNSHTRGIHPYCEPPLRWEMED